MNYHLDASYIEDMDWDNLLDIRRCMSKTLESNGSSYRWARGSHFLDKLNCLEIVTAPIYLMQEWTGITNLLSRNWPISNDVKLPGLSSLVMY